ncbi:MAG TPA: GNAT family N-acetyltransferase [Sphingobium sp.]|nr:GNAT family N-acetyltransferase [Sphingobium sp.]
MFSRTERLLLRPGWPEDARALSSALADGAVARNLIDLPAGMTEEDAAKLLTAARDPLAPYMLLFARTSRAPRLVGGCALDTEADHACALTFWIARPFWGLGFATEAAGAAIRMARAVGWKRIIARPTRDNSAAAHVLGKLGFRPMGKTEPRYSLARGREVGCALFEDSGSRPMRGDLSIELYADRAPIAA